MPLSPLVAEGSPHSGAPPFVKRGAGGIGFGVFPEWSGGAHSLAPGLHPQGVRRGCMGLKPQQHTQPAASSFLCLCKERNQRKHTPVRQLWLPCAARQFRPPRKLARSALRAATCSNIRVGRLLPYLCCSVAHRGRGGQQFSLVLCRPLLQRAPTPVRRPADRVQASGGLGEHCSSFERRSREGELRSPARMRPSKGPRQRRRTGGAFFGLPFLARQER
jgi:hypothetical protein